MKNRYPSIESRGRTRNPDLPDLAEPCAKCGRCNGHGGWWDLNAGREWVACPDCLARVNGAANDVVTPASA